MSQAVQTIPRDAYVVPDADVSYLDHELLDERGRLRALFPAGRFLCQDPLHFKLWCHKKARYGIPTIELAIVLRELIGNRSAIEIGAGNGDLGYLLGIPETDSYIQQTQGHHWAAMRQPATNPAPEVEKLAALSAIDKYRPQVVVASWFTRKFVEGKDVPGEAQASIYGEREEKILERVETYIHVGNRHVHGQKTLLKKRCREFTGDGLVSRHQDQTANVIWVWDRKP